MKYLTLVGLSVLIVLSLVFSQTANACACNCGDLSACMDKCQHYYSDPVLQNACYGGCALACWWHGNS